jgi:hypothetical protein
MKQDLTKSERPELTFIYALTTRLKKTPDKELQNLALNEMDREQPALQNFGRSLYLTGKYNRDQQVEIIRLLILMWWYYKDRLKVPHVKIADPLYLKMKAEYEAFMSQMTGKSNEHNNQLMEDYLKNYPGRFLYGYFQGTIYSDESSKLFSLPREGKAFLLSGFKIMMDCFESLVDRSKVSA